jgi:GTP cyclohydrolase I
MLKDILSSDELKNYDGLSKKDMKELLSKVYPGGEDVIRKMLELLGDDPSREGLQETPFRMLKSFLEIFKGYREDPKKILGTFFEEGLEENAADEIILVRNIAFTSTCEHHFLPFSGFAHVGYIPHKRVVGLSKISRLVESFAHRLQIQEKMCSSISQTLMDVLQPQGAAVILQAKHLCMGCRGVKNPSSDMITSSMKGKFMTQIQTRQEFLSLIK